MPSRRGFYRSGMFNYIWPVALIVLSDTFYHICTKSSPESVHPMAVLTVTYFVGMVGCIALFFVLNRGGSLVAECRKLNWVPFVLGLAIIGLEAGSLYAYRNGWAVNTMSVVKASAVAAVLLFVGRFLYNEPITWNKIVGLALYVAAVFFINLK